MPTLPLVFLLASLSKEKACVRSVRSGAVCGYAAREQQYPVTRVEENQKVKASEAGSSEPGTRKTPHEQFRSEKLCQTATNRE